jgi:hypothetical protein
MKNTYLSIIAISATLLAYSCKGPAGEIGPKGATGANGATGATGTTGAKGADGNQNVGYSEWKPLTLDKDVSTRSRGDIVALVLGTLNPAEPLFTKEALNTGSIYTYVKFNALVFNETDQTYNLVERIKLLTGSSAESASLIPGRNKSSFNSYTSTLLTNVEYRENYFDYLLVNNLIEKRTNVIPVPEFQMKDVVFFKKILLLETTLLVRHVVIYGTTKGRLASIDMNNYEEMKRALDLRD